MGLLDPTLLRNLKGLTGLLAETPIGKYVRGKDQGVSVEGLKRGLLSIPVFENTPEANQAAYEAAMNIGPMALGKIVYHGSPHKFDKFDASKIGTGEGAQAYGHGVYLADSESVARGYQEKLSDANYKIDGAPMPGNSDAVIVATQVQSMGAAGAKKYFADEAAKAASLARQSGSKKMAATAENFNRWSALVDDISARKFDVDQGGSLYKADLPDEWIPKMLDWDKPLSKQPGISGLLKMRVIKETEPSDSKFLVEFSNGVQTGFRTKREAQAFVETATGGEVIQSMSPIRGTQYTKDLSALGIPGIRYLDGGSRGKGQGSYNYVVFPGLEDQVKILERNGVPLGLLGGK